MLKAGCCYSRQAKTTGAARATLREGQMQPTLGSRQAAKQEATVRGAGRATPKHPKEKKVTPLWGRASEPSHLSPAPPGPAPHPLPSSSLGLCNQITERHTPATLENSVLSFLLTLHHEITTDPKSTNSSEEPCVPFSAAP
jgi:hypothetical protein